MSSSEADGESKLSALAASLGKVQENAPLIRPKLLPPPRMDRGARKQSFLSTLSSLPHYLVSNTVITAAQEVAQEDRNNSALVSGWNVLNLIQGIGILGVPFAISQGSWTAVILNMLVAAVTCFTGILLVDCLYTECPLTGRRVRYLKSYGDIGGKVWKRFGSQLASIIGFLELFGVVILYIILLSSTVTKLLKNVKLPWNRHYDLNYFRIMATYATLPMLFINRMSIISWFSVVAIMGLMAGIVTIFIFCFFNTSAMDVNNMQGILPDSFPVSIGIIVFSYCAHVIFPNIEESMLKPEKYPSMMVSSFVLSAIIKAALGILTVMLFGINTAQEVTDNIANDTFQITISVMLFCNVFFTIPIAMYVICERFDCVLLPHFHSSFSSGGRLHLLWIFLTRSIVLTSALFVAVNVPQFALIMGVIGSFSGTFLAFILPCWGHLVLKKHELSLPSKILRVCIMVFGTIAGGFGLTFSIIELKKAFA